MVYVLSLAAAMSNALTSVLQRIAVEDTGNSATLKVRLLARAMRRGVWLIGFALMVVSFVCQAVALHVGRLSVVQPVLTTELLFLVFILSFWFGYRVRLREWVGVGVAAAGLAGFLVFADPIGGNRVPRTSDWIVTGGLCAGGMALTAMWAHRGPRWWRAAMFATSAAIGFAFTAALTKVVTHYVAKGWAEVFSHWEVYGLAVFGVLSVFLVQNAYHAGPVAASQSALVLVDPLVSIVIGIALFGDDLRTGGGRGPLEAVSLLVLFAGAFSLSRSPLVAGIKGEGTAADEMLSGRSRPRRLAATVRTGVPGCSP
ncbi:MAG: DMT family transporter [Acidimicrobiales bacterium]